MGITEIPRSFIYTCDGCGEQHKQENAGGHYTDSRPPRWSRLTLARDAHDFHGIAVADDSIKRLLCESCSTKVAQAINAAFTKGKV